MATIETVSGDTMRHTFVSVVYTSKSVGDPALLGELKLALRQGPCALIHFNNGLNSGAGYTPESFRKGLPDVLATVRTYAPDAILVWATNPHLRGKRA
jgi:hypothetical protein